jgi:transketolase
MNVEGINSLEEKCRDIRKSTLHMLANLGIGHVGGAMTIIETAVVLYYKVMKLNPQNPKWEKRDRFILSKGHAGPAIYAILADKGYFPKEELLTLNKPKTNLPSHMDMNRTPGVDMTTGSLGQGFSAAVGQALGSLIKGDGATIYTLIGDGESDEGMVWEAAMCAAHYKLDNLVGFTDYNKLQLDGSPSQVMNLEPLKEKWEAFGWFTQEVDGHDVNAIDTAIEKARGVKGRPSMIILHTVKGKGAFFCEGKVESHNVPITKEQYEKAVELIG